VQSSSYKPVLWGSIRLKTHFLHGIRANL